MRMEHWLHIPKDRKTSRPLRLCLLLGLTALLIWAVTSL